MDTQSKNPLSTHLYHRTLLIELTIRQSSKSIKRIVPKMIETLVQLDLLSPCSEPHCPSILVCLYHYVFHEVMVKHSLEKSNALADLGRGSIGPTTLAKGCLEEK